MPEVQPPMYTARSCYTSQQDRALWNAIVCGEGVAGDSRSLRVEDTATGLQVNVYQGSAFVQGDSVEGQGVYYVESSSAVAVVLEDPDPTDDRIDLIVAKVNDTTYEGDNTQPSTWSVEVVQGAPSPAPSIPSPPPTALPLGAVRVHGGSSTITQADITDLRDRYQLCPGHAGGATELGPNVDLNTIIRPGTYTQSSTADAESGTNYPPGDQAGLLEVFRTPEGEYDVVWQRYTDYEQDRFVIWERHRHSSETWGRWYPVGGPGGWTLSVITPAAGVTGVGAIPGSAQRGVNRAGRMALQFTWSGAQMSADTIANYPDTLLFTITDPTFRPPRDTEFMFTRAGTNMFLGRVQANGQVYLIGASHPGQNFVPGQVYRMIVDWPPT